MGRKLDALLGRRRYKTSQFKATASLAVSRLAVLKNQRQARCSVARSDVVQLLNTNNYESAILRVDQVMKEQNMLDVFVVLEAYLHLLMDRVHLFEQEKVCPEEVIEAVSTLIYAATRCGEFPELQELRAIFTSQFGKEFASRAVELRNNCGVNPKVIKKLSPRMASLENKKMVLKEIASDNNIHLPVEEEEESPPVPETSVEMKEDWGERNDLIHGDDEMERSTPRRRKYKDVADAAQAAFESAAYAADAARAAVELSRSESGDSHHPTSPGLRPRNVTDQPRFDDEHIQTAEIEFENIQPLHKDDFELKKTFSSSSSESLDNHVKEDSGKIEQGNVVFDESDENDEVEGSSRAEFGRNLMEDKTQAVEPLNINRMPISVRRRWGQPR